jgi:hypothetical protein
MKKIISIILASVLVVSLVACGGSKSDNGKSTAAPSADAATTAEVTPEATPDPQELIKESLVSEDWRQLFSESTYTFSEEGTVFGSFAGSGKYEIKNNVVFITMTTQNGDSTYAFSFVTEDGSAKLIEDDNNRIFTPISNYDTVLAATKEKMAETAQELDWVSMVAEMDANEFIAREKYEGNIYKITGDAHDINETYCKFWNLKPTSTISSPDIYLTLSKEDLRKLESNTHHTFIICLYRMSSKYSMSGRGFLADE